MMPNVAPTITFGDSGLEPASGEIDVNTQIAGQQVYGEVIALAGGDYVTAWMIQQPVPYQLRAQVLDPAGNKVGAEIVVEGDGSSFYIEPLPLAAGGFAVTWVTSFGNGVGSDVRMQLFSASGERVGSEVPVNLATAGEQVAPQTAQLSNGTIVVTWSDTSQGVGGTPGDSSHSAVKARMFTADGTALGGEILVNTATFMDQTGQQITTLANGGFMVAWTDNSDYTGSGYGVWTGDVRAQAFDAAGARVGSEILLNTGVAGRQVLIDLATLDDGKVVASWKVGESDLHGQILNADGSKFGGEFVIADGLYDQGGGSITVVDGGFVLSWYDESDTKGKLQLYTNDGMAGPLATIHAARISDVAVLPGGEIAVSYTTGSYPSFDTTLQIYDAKLNRIGGPVPVDTVGNGASSLAIGADGDLLVAYRRYDGDDLGVAAKLYAPVLVANEGAVLDLKGLVTIGDVDAGSGSLTMMLSVPSGTLSVSPGSSGASVSGSGTSAVTVSGTLAQNNDLLTAAGSTVAFTSAAGSPKEVPLTLTVNDNGNTGGGALVATATRTLHVVPLTEVHYGTSGADYLNGGPGNDVFVAYGGNDTMSGGGGNDTYYVEDAGDVVIDPAGGGVDRVATSVSYTLPGAAEIETFEAITLSATTPLNLTGNDFGQAITGNAGANLLNGGGGNDVLFGLGGDDILIGGSGNDVMRGGLGNDTYFVHDAGDAVIEAVAEGHDRVAAAVSYALAPGTEIEVLEAITQSATTAINLIGNEFAQRIVGNDGANLINADGGDDVLIGLGGNDTLIGSPGNDTMYGGTGDDIYFVDSAGDLVFDNAGEGSDRVATSVSYALLADAAIEILETNHLAGTSAINLTGSSASQTIYGNDGDNVIKSGGGNDSLYGFGGNDTFIGSDRATLFVGGTGNDVYFLIDSADHVVEAVGAGHDRVAVGLSYVLTDDAEVEIFETIQLSGTEAIDLVGNQFGQTVIGNNGANVLDGKGGNDVLVGAGGADTFAFTTALGTGNVDWIEAFATGQDKIALDDAIFTAIAPGALQAGAFWTGSQANDADDRIIYDQSTGTLFYDPDGTGAAAQVPFAILSSAPLLVATDFVLI